MYKTLLIALLMSFAFGASAQEKKYFTGVLVKDLFGRRFFITSNIMSDPEDMVESVKDPKSGIKGLTVLWAGNGEVQDGKILWVDEAYFVIPSNPVMDFAGVGGNGIEALKLFLSGEEGSAIKAKFFTSTTEYITSDKTNAHATEGLNAIQSSFRNLLGSKLNFLADDIQDITKVITDKDAIAKELLLMQAAAKDVLSIYELSISVEPSLATTAYKDAKPYLEKIANNENEELYKDLGEKWRRSITALANEVQRTYKNALCETSIVSAKNGLFKAPLQVLLQKIVQDKTTTMPEDKTTPDENAVNEVTIVPADESVTDDLSEEYTVQTAYSDLRDIKAIDAATLLGEKGLLTKALNMVDSEMGKKGPDVVTCSKIMELVQIMISKLEEKKADVTLVAEKFTSLSDKITAYNEPTVADNTDVDIGATLDEIIKKGKLTQDVLEKLFGKENSLVSLILQKRNKDPMDPLNKIRALIIEKILRRFEAKFNGNGDGLSKGFYSAIRDNDFLKDREAISAWRKFVDNIEYQDLTSTNKETRKEVKKYEEVLESIGDLKFGVK